LLHVAPLAQGAPPVQQAKPVAPHAPPSRETPSDEGPDPPHATPKTTVQGSARSSAQELVDQARLVGVITVAPSWSMVLMNVPREDP
jgi:hypothetical protein